VAAIDLWKRGSRRRVAQIRWRRREIVQALLLGLFMIAFTLFVGIWVATHHFD